MKWLTVLIMAVGSVNPVLAQDSETEDDAVKKTSFFLNVKSQDRKYEWSGSGFVVVTDSGYYLVTACHLVYKDSTIRINFPIPTLSQSNEVITIHSSNNIDSIIHTQDLIDKTSKKLLYKYYPIDSSHALDLVILKLDNPPVRVKNYAIPIWLLDTSRNRISGDTCIVLGFPATHKRVLAIKGFALPGVYKGIGFKYVFNLTSMNHMQGASGSPVFVTTKNEIKLGGIFIGEFFISESAPSIGFAIYAVYIIELIARFELGLI